MSFIVKSSLSNTDPADVLLLLSVLLVLVIRGLHPDCDQLARPPPGLLHRGRGQRAQGHHQGGHQVVAEQDLGGIHLVCLKVMSTVES